MTPRIAQKTAQLYFQRGPLEKRYTGHEKRRKTGNVESIERVLIFNKKSHWQGKFLRLSFSDISQVT